MNDYMQSLAAATGLAYYPKKGPFENSAGAAMGARDGFLVAVGPAKNAKSRSIIAILIRFLGTHETTNYGAIMDAVRAAAGKHTVKDGEKFIQVEMGYTFGKPKVEAVAFVLAELITGMRNVAPPFNGRCEICQLASASEITLHNSIPGYFCGGCQAKADEEARLEESEYERRETNFPAGLLLGAAAALAGALAWGFVAFWLERIFLWGAIGIGFLVAAAVIKGMGKVHLAGQVMIFLLTVGSVLLGDAIFYTLAVMKEYNLAFSMSLLGSVLGDLWTIETSGDGVISVGFAVAGAGYAIYSMRRPRFTPTFERLTGSAEDSQSMAAGAGKF